MRTAHHRSRSEASESVSELLSSVSSIRSVSPPPPTPASVHAQLAGHRERATLHGSPHAICQDRHFVELSPAYRPSPLPRNNHQYPRSRAQPESGYTEHASVHSRYVPPPPGRHSAAAPRGQLVDDIDYVAEGMLHVNVRPEGTAEIPIDGLAPRRVKKQSARTQWYVVTRGLKTGVFQGW